MWHPGRAGDETQWQPGEAIGGARGELLPVRHDAGGGADEQPGRASDPVRGDRPLGHAGDAERGGQPLVRADLDGDRDVHSARSFGVCVPGGGGRGVVRWERGSVAVTRRLRGREVRWCRWGAQVQGPVGPGSPEGRPPVTTSTRGRGSSCATWVEARDRGQENQWSSIGECTRTPTDRSTKIAINPAPNLIRNHEIWWSTEEPL